MRPPGRLPGIRRIPPRLARIEPKTVLFDSWRGKYADNPRAVSEELHRRDPSFRQIWVLEEDDPLLPKYVEPVVPCTWSHLAWLGRAQYVVSNGGMPIYWRKKPGQRYLQTWHGSPLKKLAFDIENPQWARAERYLRHFSRDVESWDMLLSQSTFASEVQRGCFRYEGPILESGYPRNDLLVAPDSAAARAATRARLGIEGDARVVLWAPTWRDSYTFDLDLDLGAVADQLGPGTVFLLRAHNHVAKTVAAQPHPRVIDVSRIPDPREILLASDAMIADYSSIIFDFAITRKPIILFIHDIEHYRDELRGMYVDLEAEAPGPMVRTVPELVSALRGLENGVVSEYRSAHERFVARHT
ncbi:MAG TPA: CDP-glycerol glycerophosphotransferase family protein, partial [Thermoleophilaceae bacterium]